MIDEVIHAIKPEFEEYGVAEDVLAELQHVSSSSIILTHDSERMSITTRYIEMGK